METQEERDQKIRNTLDSIICNVAMIFRNNEISPQIAVSVLTSLFGSLILSTKEEIPPRYFSIWMETLSAIIEELKVIEPTEQSAAEITERMANFISSKQ